MILHQPTSRGLRFGIPSFSSLAPDHVAGRLAQQLDDGYHYLPRLRIGGQPLHAVIVGPGGTWTITPDHEAGRFRKRNGHWYRWNRSTESWVPWEAEPVLRARLTGHRLELHLDAAGVPSSVEPVLLVAPDVEIEWEPPERPGVHVIDEATRLARRVSRDEVLTPAQVDRIVALLDPRQPMRRLAPSTPHG